MCLCYGVGEPVVEATHVHYIKNKHNKIILPSLGGLEAMTANTIHQTSPFKMKVQATVDRP